MKSLQVIFPALLTLAVFAGQSECFFKYFNFASTFGYAIECNDDACCSGIQSPADLNFTLVSRNIYKHRSVSVLTLLEAAVNRNGTDYAFGLFYAGSSTGYKLNHLSGVNSNDRCTWNVYVEGRDMPLPPENCLYFRVRRGNTVTFRYEEVGNEATVLTPPDLS